MKAKQTPTLGLLSVEDASETPKQSGEWRVRTLSLDLPTLSSPDPPRKPPPTVFSQLRDFFTQRWVLLCLGTLAAAVMIAAAVTTGVLVHFRAPVDPTQVPPGPIAAWPTGTNPVINFNYPDPFVLHVDGTFYSFATNDFGSNVQTRTSTNLLNWTKLPDSLPVLPPWGTDHWVWAPNVHLSSSGNYQMFYAGRYDLGNTSRMAVGVAVSVSGPAGPYQPVQGLDSQPFVDMPEEGGAIDPTYFKDDDGSQYIIWKSDGNAVGAACAIWCQQLAADGLSRLGEPWPLIRNDQPWEYQVIEAPNMAKQGSTYFLYYSAGHYYDWSYTVAYATSPSILGPFKKQGQALKTDGDLVGPGKSCTVTLNDGSIWLVFHSLYYLTDRNDPRVTYRAMDILPMSYVKGVPLVQKSWGSQVQKLYALGQAPASSPH